MTATAEQLSVDAARLSGVVRHLLQSESAEVVEWQMTPLTAGMSDAGVYRVTGHAREHGKVVPWAVVLKVVERAPDDDEPGSWGYWQREPLLYASGLLNDLPSGLRSVRCHLVEHPSPEAAWVWLEVLAEQPSGRRSHARYATVARRLGAFNGAYLTGRPIPTAPWLASAWYRSQIGWSNPTIERLKAHDDHLIVRQFWPRWIMPGIGRLWDDRELLLGTLDRLPQVFCHGDAVSRDLFLQTGDDGEEELVAIDWAFAGPGAIGQDAALLFQGVLAFLEVTPAELPAVDQVVFTAYLDGLREAGWDGDERLARLGYTASVALRDGLCAVGFAFDDVLRSSEETAEAICQAVYNRSAAEALTYRPQMIAYALQLGEEARQLAHDLQ